MRNVKFILLFLMVGGISIGLRWWFGLALGDEWYDHISFYEGVAAGTIHYRFGLTGPWVRRRMRYDPHLPLAWMPGRSAAETCGDAKSIGSCCRAD